jgi:alpha-ketoglutarate-dependent taurine dioxygenase
VARTLTEPYDAAVENVGLVIRGQAHITAAQLRAAGEMFGGLMEDQNRRYLVDGFPLISVLDNRHLDSRGRPAKVPANATWHTDHANQELPPKFTFSVGNTQTAAKPTHNIACNTLPCTFTRMGLSPLVDRSSVSRILPPF